MPHTVSDVLVVLKRDQTRTSEELEDAMRERLSSVPGVAVLFTTPPGMRIDEGLGGTPADIAVRIFGPDLDQLSTLAENARRSWVRCRGSPTQCADATSGPPQLRITADRQATARVGLALA